MKQIVAALLLLAPAPAVAAECFALEGDPSWTITVNDPGVEPEMLWKQGEKTVELGTGTGGTGVPTRVAYDMADDDMNTAWVYRFYKDILIVEMDIYERGCP